MKITLTKIIILSLIVFLIGSFFVSLKKTSLYDTKNLVGQNIDSFQLKSLKDDLEINEELLKKNEFTLINFWASWCAPCRAEHKYLVNLNKNAQNLKLLGINFKDDKSNAVKFLKNFGDPFHFLGSDTDGRVSINSGVYGIPESILVNQKLEIVKKFIGPLNESEYKNILELTN